MSLAWPLMLLAALPPLAAHGARLGASVVIFLGGLGFGALALANGRAVTHRAGPALPAGTDPLFDMDFSGLASFILLWLFALTVLIAAAQAAKERLGTPDRLTTLVGFWMYFAGSLLTLALGTATAHPEPRGTLSDISGTVALAGLLVLAYAILIRPLLSRLRRAARRST